MKSKILPWDSGNEVKEPPGTETNRPDQIAAHSGLRENGRGLDIAGIDNSFTYLSVSTLVRVTIVPQ